MREKEKDIPLDRLGKGAMARALMDLRRELLDLEREAEDVEEMLLRLLEEREEER